VEGRHLHALRKDGTEFPVEIELSSLMLEVPMILSSVTDITEKIIQENNKLKGDFVSNISHELRTPMNIIMGFTEMLLDQSFGSLNDVQQEMLRDVKNSGTHLLRLINDILDLSKIESGKMDLNIDSFDLNEAVQEVIRTFKTAIEGRGLTVTVDIPDMAKVRLDKIKFQQIIHNLVLNSIQYNKPHGNISIKAELKDVNFFQMHIRDTGIGISVDNMGKLFMPFVRCDPTNTRTGLGLTLAKSLVELHRGTIKAESTFGEGSTFTLTMPIKLM
jgi:protein-histidine pros-kinase